MALVSKSEFARAKGVTPAAITYAIKSGRIRDAVVLEKGKEMLNLELGLELWQRNMLQLSPTNPAGRPRGRPPKKQAVASPAPTTPPVAPPVEPRRRTAAAPPAEQPTDQQLRAFIQGLPEDQIPDLNDSRARREHYLAEKARLEALQGRAELLPADQVKKEAFALARAVRDGMLGIADRLAPLLAATTDARQVHQLLDQEIRVALRGLADG